MTMGGNIIYLVLGLIGLLIVVGLGSLAARRRFKGLDTARYAERWKDLQKLCGREDTWPLAIINADKLVDDALRACHYKGKTMGERLVKAQRDLTDNDGIWFGHKLRNKLVHEDFSKLNRKMMLDALSGFRQALRDLGALR